MSECRHDHHSPIVAVVLVFAPGLERPYPLIPGEEYRFCADCDVVFKFVEKAIEAHPATRTSAAGPYTKAVVLFDDGESQEIEPDRAFVGLA